MSQKFKIGDRVEIVNYSAKWDGPATVVADKWHSDGYVTVQQDPGGWFENSHGEFPLANLRPLGETSETPREYKIGDRVEIFGYSDRWNGPAVVTKNSAERGWVNVQQLKGGAHAGVPATFTRENIRPLKDESVPEGTLDPSDPFEATLIDIVATNRSKRRDYTGKGDSPWSNFDAVERQTGGAFNSSVETLIAVKQARLAALQTREGGPVNESVEDTILDRAVYAVIALARIKYPKGVVE